MIIGLSLTTPTVTWRFSTPEQPITFYVAHAPQRTIVIIDKTISELFTSQYYCHWGNVRVESAAATLKPGFH